MAAVNEFVSRLTGRRDIKLCRDSIFLSEVFGPLDNSKIVRDLGWEPRPVEQTVKDAISWFSEQKRTKHLPDS